MKKFIRGFSDTCNNIASVGCIVVGLAVAVGLIVAIGHTNPNKPLEGQPVYHKKILAEPYWSDQIEENTPYIPAYEKQYPERPHQK